MKLGLERLGSGPPVVLIHGWAMDAEVLRPWAETLVAGGRSVILVELPGHGHTPDARFSAPELGAELAQRVDEPAWWVGWSLGGQICLEALAAGAPARGALLVAATPRFSAGVDWPCGVDPAELAALRQTLDREPAAAVAGFLALLARAGDADRRAVRGLRRSLPETPGSRGLASGLTCLAGADYRDRLAALAAPLLWLAGERDPLVPPEAARQAAAGSPRGACRVLPEAGHLAFLTHPAAVTAALESVEAQRA